MTQIPEDQPIDGYWSVDDDGDGSLFVTSEGTVIGRIYDFTDFPCLDEDDPEFSKQAFDRQLRATAYMMARAKDMSFMLRKVVDGNVTVQDIRTIKQLLAACHAPRLRRMKR